jgi:hypothetical protein
MESIWWAGFSTEPLLMDDLLLAWMVLAFPATDFDVHLWSQGDDVEHQIWDWTDPPVSPPLAQNDEIVATRTPHGTRAAAISAHSG